MWLIYGEIECGKEFVLPDGLPARAATTSWCVYRFAWRSLGLAKEGWLISRYAPSL